MDQGPKIKWHEKIKENEIESKRERKQKSKEDKENQRALRYEQQGSNTYSIYLDEYTDQAQKKTSFQKVYYRQQKKCVHMEKNYYSV